MTRKKHLPETYSIWEDEVRRHFLARKGEFIHQMFFYQVAVSYEHPVIIELGVRDGESTRAFLAGVGDAGGKLYSCDLGQIYVPAEWHQLQEWSFIKGDDISLAVLLQMPQKADVIFIDTLHTYEHVMKELEHYIPRLNPGGVALLHDTALNEAVNPGCRHDDVLRAMQDYCAKHDLRWENHTANWGMGIIWAPSS